jgi:hypothetical protein
MRTFINRTNNRLSINKPPIFVNATWRCAGIIIYPISRWITMQFNVLVLVGLAIGGNLLDRASAAECVGADGQSVDFWTILKKPHSGEFVYLDSRERQLQAQEVTLDQSVEGNPLFQTLEQLYKYNKDTVKDSNMLYAL